MWTNNYKDFLEKKVEDLLVGIEIEIHEKEKENMDKNKSKAAELDAFQDDPLDFYNNEIFKEKE